MIIRGAALLTALNMSATKHLCLKTHNAKVEVNSIPLVFPEISGGGVYIIRDPRDIVLSYAVHLGYSIDKTIETLNEQGFLARHQDTNLVHFLTTWSTHVTSWTVKNTNIPIEVVRYEDMLTDPEVSFRKILKGVQITDIDEDRFAFALKESSFSNLQRLESKGEFRENGKGGKFFRKGKSGQWRMKLSKEQSSAIEENHSEVMAEHGYLL